MANTELMAYVQDYLQTLKRYEDGEATYMEIEIEKLELADYILRSFGQPTAPGKIPKSLPKPPLNLQEFNRRHKPTKVYVMLNKRNGLHKIGISERPEYREATLQSQEPEVELISSWDGDYASEQRLHSMFSHKRVRGEWFKLETDDLELICKTMEGDVSL